MICPKCGFEQPDGPECLRCGIIISRYKGPVLGEAARPAAAPPPPLPPSDALPPAPMAASPAYTPPAPAMAAAAGGRMYNGPVPAVAGGGTMYEGPAAGTPAPSVATTQPAARGSLDLGKVLAETFSIFFRNFVPFLLLTAVALSPMLLLLFVLLSGAMKEMEVGMTIGLLVLAVLCFLFGAQLATASITYGVFQQMRNRDVSVADCLSRGLSSLFPVVGLVIIQTLGILAGAIACIIPGIILALRWSVSVPAAVEERPGALGALRRSTFLTDGHKGTIFAILFIINILSNALTKLLEMVFSNDPSALLMGIGAVIFLSTGFTATATAIMYYRLRSIKESIDVDQIASVFA